ncbi:MAG: tetratricopeptide repeat protein, partial [Bacteroidia bacterium]|nr:tetratricopeptide repeat protein [Bacteroidia bacterium]
MKTIKISLLFFFIVATCVSQGDKNKVIDSLLKVISFARQDSNEAKAFAHLSLEYEAKGDFDKGIEAAEKGVSLAKKISWQRGEADNYKSLANNYLRKSEFDKALQFNQLAMDIYVKLNDLKGIGGYYGLKGVIYKNKGDYPEALVNQFKSLEIAKKAGRKKAMAGCLGNIGSVYMLMGNYPKAIENLINSLKVFEELGLKQNVAINLGNIGNLYSKTGDYDKAIEFQKKSLLLREELGDKDGVALVASSLGGIYYQKNESADAIKYYEKSSERCLLTGNKLILSANKVGLGCVYERLQENKKARQYFEEGIALKKEIGDEHGLAVVYVKMADLNFNENNLQASKKYASLALEIANKFDNSEIAEQSNFQLYTIYKKEGNIAKALYHYEQRTMLRDTIKSSSNQKFIQQKQLEYEFDKRSFADSVKHKQEMKAGELELASQKAELKHEQTQRYMLYGGLALLLIVAGVVWKAYANKKKDNIEIQLQKSETERQKHLVEEKQQELIDSIYFEEG